MSWPMACATVVQPSDLADGLAGGRCRGGRLMPPPFIRQINRRLVRLTTRPFIAVGTAKPSARYTKPKANGTIIRCVHSGWTSGFWIGFGLGCRVCTTLHCTSLLWEYMKWRLSILESS